MYNHQPNTSEIDQQTKPTAKEKYNSEDDSDDFYVDEPKAQPNLQIGHHHGDDYSKTGSSQVLQIKEQTIKTYSQVAADPGGKLIF